MKIDNNQARTIQDNAIYAPQKKTINEKVNTDGENTEWHGHLHSFGYSD
jgi:hypothetical protein